jgi:hypothetical protein
VCGTKEKKERKTKSSWSFICVANLF